MIVELKIPQIGESISEVQISRWFVADKEFVNKDQEVVEIDTDKTSMNLVAPATGIITILIKEGETVNIGLSIAQIDETAEDFKQKLKDDIVELENDEIANSDIKSVTEKEVDTNQSIQFTVSPLAKKIIQENEVDEQKLFQHVLRRRIGVDDVNNFIENQNKNTVAENTQAKEDMYSKKMSPLRKKIAQRLVSVKNETAMLTTFNEVDMSKLIEIRNKYKEEFFRTHGIKLGFVSFFAKAVSIALKLFPEINAMIDGDEIIYHNVAHIGIAISTNKGLLVPVVRNAHTMNIAEIEKNIDLLAQKARENKLLPAELDGGTFTITNGGVFGSLFSTPIINPPQSAILGMHTVQDRAVVVTSEIVIRPMMYISLSYDHRLIDGKESVGFITTVKKLLEYPNELMNEGVDMLKFQLSLK